MQALKKQHKKEEFIKKKLLCLVLDLSLAFSLSAAALASDKSGKANKSDKDNKTEEVSKPEKPEKQKPNNKNECSDSEPGSAPDSKPDSKPNPEPDSAAVITAGAAEETALTYAGFASTAVKGLHAYKLYASGQAYAYRVEFGVYDRSARQTTVFTYEISLEDGAIVSASSIAH